MPSQIEGSRAVAETVGLCRPDSCKGCGLCMQECPCGAIEMEPDPV